MGFLRGLLQGAHTHLAQLPQTWIQQNNVGVCSAEAM